MSDTILDHPSTFAISGLKRARTDLQAKIVKLDSDRRSLLRQIEALEVSLRVLDPNVEIDGKKAITYPRRPYPANLGEVTKSVFKALRLAPSPMSVAEVVEAIMYDRGIGLEDRASRAVLRDRVGVCLRKQRIRGIVRSHDGGRWPVWEVVPI